MTVAFFDSVHGYGLLPGGTPTVLYLDENIAPYSIPATMSVSRRTRWKPRVGVARNEYSKENRSCLYEAAGGMAVPVMAPLAAATLRAPPGRKDYKQECSTQWRMGETVWPLQASIPGSGPGFLTGSGC